MLKKIISVSVGLCTLSLLSYIAWVERRLYALNQVKPQVTQVYHMPEYVNEVPIWMSLGQYDRVLAMIDTLPDEKRQTLSAQIKQETERRKAVLAAINELLYTPDTVYEKKGPFYFESTAKKDDLTELKMILQLGWLSVQNGFVGWDDIQEMLQVWLDQSDTKWRENPSVLLLTAKHVGGENE